MDGTQAKDRVGTEGPAGIQTVVSDKAAVPEKAVGIDGKVKEPDPKGPAFSMTKRSLSR